METTVNTLMNFIQTAERSRKYPSNTADAFRVAIRLFEKDLNDEERASIDVLSDHLDQIYSSVVNHNSTKFSLGSLETYKKRIQRVLREYSLYGKDATKMTNWKPKMRVFTKKKKQEEQSEESRRAETKETPFAPMTTGDLSDSKLSKYEIQLRSDTKALIIIPFDLSTDEADKLKLYIDLNTTGYKPKT